MDNIIDLGIDIANAEPPELLPVRGYPAEIRKASPAVSGKTGAKYVSIQFYINPDDFPADYDQANNPDGLTLTFNRVSLEKNTRSLSNLRKFMETIGAPIKGGVIDFDDWTGLRATVNIGHEEYEGNNREVVKSVTKLV